MQIGKCWKPVDVKFIVINQSFVSGQILTVLTTVRYTIWQSLLMFAVATVAQLVEHLIRNESVAGSNPVSSSNL